MSAALTLVWPFLGAKLRQRLHSGDSSVVATALPATHYPAAWGGALPTDTADALMEQLRAYRPYTTMKQWAAIESRTD